MKIPPSLAALTTASLVAFFAVSSSATPSSEAASAASKESSSPLMPQAHGPQAPGTAFPSHHFRLAAHTPERVQLAFHYGLLQPLLLHGFNAAVDVRYQRLVLTYSHGQGLDVSGYLGRPEKATGFKLLETWTTGGGVGLLLLDELWVLADVKVHRFEASNGVQDAGYTNLTLGAELGWRFFIWKGLNLGVVARYWPTVYSSAGSGITLRDAQGVSVRHRPQAQGYAGFFGNVLLGWAFEL
jgi:hypothetical protein